MRPNLARDETQELEERRYSLCPAARREHIVRQVVTVILRLGVVLKKDLDVTPLALYRVRVGAGFWIFERDAMVDGAVLVTLRVAGLRTPAIADDLRAWFDPFTYKIHQRVGGCLVREQEMFCRTLVRHRQTPTDPEQGALYYIFADRSCSHQFRRSYWDHRSSESCPPSTRAWLPCRTYPSQ